MYSYYVPPAAGTPWRPAWSPDGKGRAFSMSGSIWKIGAGDTVAHELTANRTNDSSPAWSPAGRSIAYTAEDERGVNLMLLNVATGEISPGWRPERERRHVLDQFAEARRIFEQRAREAKQ